MLSPRVASLQVKASSGLYVSGSTKDRAERIDLHNGRTLPGSFMWFDVVIRKVIVHKTVTSSLPYSKPERSCFCGRR